MRTDANVADVPSRVDLRGVEFDVGEWFESRALDGLVSEPVRCVMPRAEAWAEPASAWMRAHA